LPSLLPPYTQQLPAPLPPRRITLLGRPPAHRLPHLYRTAVPQGGDVRELDFRFYLGDTKIGAPFHGLRAFFTTPQVRLAGAPQKHSAPQGGQRGCPGRCCPTSRCAASLCLYVCN
jgi:hypothetical protein